MWASPPYFCRCKLSGGGASPYHGTNGGPPPPRRRGCVLYRRGAEGGPPHTRPRGRVGSSGRVSGVEGLGGGLLRSFSKPRRGEKVRSGSGMGRQQPPPRSSGAAVRAPGDSRLLSEPLFQGGNFWGGRYAVETPVVSGVGAAPAAGAALRQPSPGVPGAAVRSPLSPTGQITEESGGWVERTETSPSVPLHLPRPRLASPLFLPAAFPPPGSVPGYRGPFPGLPRPRPARGRRLCTVRRRMRHLGGEPGGLGGAGVVVMGGGDSLQNLPRQLRLRETPVRGCAPRAPQ